jgi:drug/metabolite transporter (DMT)-like permease
MKEHQTLKGVAYVLFSILIWSGWMVASRYGVKGSLSASDITVIRFGVAGMLLLPVAIRKGLAVGPYGIRGGALLAICIGAPYTNLAVEGMAYAPASHASTVINGSLLILTTVVGIHGLKEPTSRLRLAGVAFSLIGIGCMLAAKSATSSPHQWIGHLLFVISGLMWGTYTLLLRAWRTDALHAAAAVCVFSLIGYLPLYLLFAQSHIGLANWREVAFQAVYQGVLTGVVALISFNHGVRILGASHASVFIPLVPVLSTLLAIPILHEIPSALEWAGVAAVSSGVLLASGVLSRRAGPPS